MSQDQTRETQSGAPQRPGALPATTEGPTTGRGPVVALEDATKSYGAVQALRGARLELHDGEVHALVGENGAGKSTLIKVLAGVHQPDSGRLTVDGRPVTFRSTADAMAAGIAVIYQEPTLFPDLSVAENIFVGRQPLGRARAIDRRAMNAAAAELFDRLAVPLRPERLASGLSIADQQLVEIAKALSVGARVLIMDEPTAALSGVEVDRLFSVVRGLRDLGAAVLFISHRFREVEALCERVTVMRDGRHVSTDLMADVTVDELVRRMVGRDLSALFPKQDVEPGEVVLDVEGLTRAGVFADITFQVRAGEIVALAGLVGSGRSEVAQAVFGVDPRDSGTVKVAGREVPAHRPKAAMAAGLALVSEDRRQQGLVLDLSIERNITLPRSRSLATLGLLTGRAERSSAREWAGRLQTRFSAITAPVATLSGGNQQKVVLAKWLSTEPKVLIVDEPTRGIDVATKAEVHRLVSDLAASGVAVLMVSSELPEVLGMADRVLVMREGRIAADIPRAEATEESIVRAGTTEEAA
ncbi:MAG: sugar ABC transporter ATP-binding protein [Actinomycetaceae bacterium]